MTNKKTNQSNFSFPNEKDTRAAYDKLNGIQMSVLRAYYGMADEAFTTCWANADDIAVVAGVTYREAVDATLALNKVDLIHPNPDYAFKTDRWSTLLNPHVTFAGVFDLTHPLNNRAFDKAVSHAVNTKGPGIAAPLNDTASLSAYLQRHRINTTPDDLREAIGWSIESHLRRWGFLRTVHWHGLQIAVDMGVIYPDRNPHQQAHTRAVVVIEYSYNTNNGSGDWLVVTAFNAFPGHRRAAISLPLDENQMNLLLSRFTNV